MEQEDTRVATVGDGPLQDGAVGDGWIASSQDDQVSKLHAKVGPCTLHAAGLRAWWLSLALCNKMQEIAARSRWRGSRVKDAGSHGREGDKKGRL